MLYVICGHGDGDPGACAGGYTEAELNRMLGKAIAKLGRSEDVKLMNTEVDHYQEMTLSKQNFNSDDKVLEIHMDAFGDDSAKGGHVIISEAYEADEWDEKLCDMMQEYFPGRSQVLVKRGDLYNVNICKERGINYRLCEFGFITNERDREFVLNNTELVAKKVLECFGLEVKEPAKPEVVISRCIEMDKWFEITPEVKFHVDKFECKF